MDDLQVCSRIVSLILSCYFSIICNSVHSLIWYVFFPIYSDTVGENWGDSPRSVLSIYREFIKARLRIWMFRSPLTMHVISLIRTWHRKLLVGIFAFVFSHESAQKD